MQERITAIASVILMCTSCDVASVWLALPDADGKLNATDGGQQTADEVQDRRHHA